MPSGHARWARVTMPSAQPSSASTPDGVVTISGYRECSTGDVLLLRSSGTQNICYTEELAVTLFRLDSSIRTEGSISREVADVVEDAWVGHVVRRDIGLAPLPADAWPTAVAASQVPEEARTPEQRRASALAATLGDELLDAQAVLIA